MKELYNGLKTFIGATLISILYHPLAVPYQFGHALYLSVSLEDPKAFFVLIWRFTDGMLAAVGYLLFHTAVAQDMTWNVNGELIEDVVTHRDKTSFGEKNITVSSSVGELEEIDKLLPFGHTFSKVLNKAFNQKHHAVGSWKYHTAKIKLEKEHFKKPD